MDIALRNIDILAGMEVAPTAFCVRNVLRFDRRAHGPPQHRVFDVRQPFFCRRGRCSSWIETSRRDERCKYKSVCVRMRTVQFTARSR